MPRWGSGGGGRQPQRSQIVDLIQIVELGREQHLSFVIERRVVAEVQVVEFAGVREFQVVEVKAVQRQNFGDFVAVRLSPVVAVEATSS